MGEAFDPLPGIAGVLIFVTLAYAVFSRFKLDPDKIASHLFFFTLMTGCYFALREAWRLQDAWARALLVFLGLLCFYLAGRRSLGKT